MHRTPSQLPKDARAEIVRALNARLADGLDLHSQINRLAAPWG